MGKHLILITSIASLVLTGCAYKIDVQQGNVITQKQVNQLRPGMTPDQVRYVLGTPLLRDPFHPRRWDYVYSLQEGGGSRQMQYLTLLFDADQTLKGLHGDFRPHPKAGLEASEVTTVEVPPRKIEKGIFELLGDLVKNLFS
ncbi:MAG: outer membrane protein assembly factor BamE [Methylohalobius sp. ZOD2]